MLLSGTLKLWNVKTTACIRTMDCGYAICSTFLPEDRHVRTLWLNHIWRLSHIPDSSLLAQNRVIS